MASWKKIIVSGSSAELSSLQVDNLLNGVVTGSNDGTLGIVSINGTGNILATTGGTGVSLSGSFSGSFTGDGSGLTGVIASSPNALTQGEGISVFSYNGSTAQTVAVSGAADLNSNVITKWNDTDGKFENSSLTDNGTAITGTTSIQLSGASSSLTGSFTGSFVGDGSGLTGIATTLDISGSNGTGISIDLKTQDLTITGTANEIETSVAGTTVTIGLPSDVTIGNNLTVTGDLTVNGTTVTINTTELLVEDKFILLASGSASAGDGGIIIDRGSDGDGNIAFGYDSTTDRWGFQNGFTDTTNDITIGTNGNSAFAGLVFTEASHTTRPTTGEFVQAGAIYTETSGDIYIYS
jgi:hypothetical protein